MAATAPARLLDPGATAAVVLGAHDWTDAGLGRAPSFLRSARGVVAYLYDPVGLGLHPELVLDLFDDTAPSGEQLAEIRDALDSRLRERRDEGRPVTDLLVYYVGHGHTDDQGHLSLLVRRSRRGMEAETGIKAPDLARVLKVAAPQQRRVVVLDCCFSEAAARDFIGQSGALDQAVASIAANDLGDDEPRRGTLLLCSSPVSKVSMAPSNATHTLFTGAVLDVLREGAEGKPPALSFADLRDAAYHRMVVGFGANAPRPVLHQVNAAQGDLTRTPAFPNRDHARREAAKREAEEQARREAAKREAEEQARREAAKREAEEQARREAAKREAEEQARREAAKREAEEQARREAAKREAEEQARREAAKREAEEQARREAAKREAEEQARRETAEAAGTEARPASTSPPERMPPPDTAELQRLGIAVAVPFSVIALAAMLADRSPPAPAPALTPQLVAPPRSSEEIVQLGSQRERGGNYVEAARLYRLAADQGNADAQANLGRLYEWGFDQMAKDEREAARLYRLAADQGNAWAQAQLGRFYELGRGGLAKNLGEAVRWYQRAAQAGQGLAQERLESLDANRPAPPAAVPTPAPSGVAPPRSAR